MISNRLTILSLAVAFALSCPLTAGAAEQYAVNGDCDGFPRVGLKTMSGSCVGLVAAHLGFIRGLAVIGQDVYVADMGGWHRGKGRILRLADGGKSPPAVLLKGLDEPNGLALGPNGSLYVGLLGKVIRFDPGAPDLASTVRDVVINLPDTGRHPLDALAVAPDGSLFLNVGSATDHCEGTDGAAPDPKAICPETTGSSPRGVILHVVPGDAPIDAGTVTPYARGLRNSMALAVLPSGAVVAGVNARDYIDQADPALSDEALPHDTFDRVEQGADYGWPYCYDANIPSPEYPHFDCAAKHAPTLLLPPHAAPLGMILYGSDKFPALRGKAVIAFHGYRSDGHRIVALPLDAHGVPTGPLMDVVSDWDVLKGKHPQGAPVGIVEQADGSILIAEDHNGTLLRLAHSAP
jgi:glucose/arabinose dehydrogenase